jgi:tRNA G37 N-methylase TrmD
VRVALYAIYPKYQPDATFIPVKIKISVSFRAIHGKTGPRMNTDEREFLVDNEPIVLVAGEQEGIDYQVWNFIVKNFVKVYPELFYLF